MMDKTSQAFKLDEFLRNIYQESRPMSLAEGILKRRTPPQDQKQNYISMEYLIEELGVVDLIRGRDNSTTGGQCEYKINRKGRKMVENDEPLLDLIFPFENAGKELMEEYGLTHEDFKKRDDEIVSKRVAKAEELFDKLPAEYKYGLTNEKFNKYFRQWFWKTKEFDLQVKDGDFVIEDGDIQIVPEFSEMDMPSFFKWWKQEGNSLVELLKKEGLHIPTNQANQSVVNYGEMIYNNQSPVGQQTLKTTEQIIKPEKPWWKKGNVVIGILIALAAAIIATIQLFI